jgi:hypothetical protein
MDKELIKIMTYQGFKELNQNQYDLYCQINKAYDELRKDEALKLLNLWEKNYPNLKSYLFFNSKEIKSKNYKSWVNPQIKNRLSNLWTELKSKQ